MGCKRKIRPCCKWRIDIDQINLPCEFLKERSHHQEVVSPDELVSPTFLKGLPFLSVPKIKKGHLLSLLFGLPRGPALVDGLNYLKGQIHPRDFFQGPVFIVLSRPDQFGFGDLDFRHANPLVAMC